MLHVFAHLWLFFIGAALLGVSQQLRQPAGSAPVLARPYFQAALVVFAAGALVAYFALLPGRAGFWLETALGLSGALALGSVASGLVMGVRQAVINGERLPSPHPGARPPGNLTRENRDDLCHIHGIDAATRERLYDLGILQFRQIARWSPRHAIWVGHEFQDLVRVSRERWIEQAADLVRVTAETREVATADG
ncbi:MAG: putative 5 nuclease, flap endonuclease-like, helix-3-turn-helix domain [Hyphomicrobiales bacterium]|nr:putative 5 nuclease, flap endonuclease-like, helix-3-turn-helix domain [Hyphomicrobiales bacterium]